MAREARPGYFSAVDLASSTGWSEKIPADAGLVGASRSFGCPQAPPSVREKMEIQARVLTIVDTFSRFSPAVEPRFNFRGGHVVEVLERVGRQGDSGGDPCRSGHRVRLTDLGLWAYQRGVTLDFSRPGKPTDNAFIESFNAKFRAECLNAHSMSLDDARRKCEACREYNEERPHSAIGDKASIEVIGRSVAHGPP
jgi:putative transposase